MKKNHTDITIILDRSGSMQSVKDDTIGGFNSFLNDQKKAAGSVTITLHQFDDQYETVLDGTDIQTAKPLDGKTFVPRGMTALLDAIGRSINDTGKRLESTPEQDRPEKVVCVIITDGAENSSHEFTRPQIMDMIQHQTDKYGWQFVFLGANQDAIKAAQSMGVQANQAMTYAANSAGTTAAFAAVSENLRSFRTGQSEDLSYSTKQRELQRKAGAKL